MVRPKLVAFDVDGTLLDHRGSCTDRTRETLARLRDAGVTTTIATGRPRASINETLAITGPVDFAVCGNGSTVTDVASGGVVHQTVVSGAVVAPLIETIRREIPGVATAAELHDDAGLEEPGFAHRIPFRRDHVKPVPDVLAVMGDPPTDVHRVTFFHDDYDDDIFALARKVEPHLPDGCAMYSGSQLPLVEILPHGQNKGVAVARLAEHLGVSAADAMAFGDGTNDVEMFEWVGVGIAMGRHCHPDLLAVAAGVTDPVSGDGVANYLSQLFDW